MWKGIFGEGFPGHFFGGRLENEPGGWFWRPLRRPLHDTLSHAWRMAIHHAHKPNKLNTLPLVSQTPLFCISGFTVLQNGTPTALVRSEAKAFVLCRASFFVARTKVTRIATSEKAPTQTPHSGLPHAPLPHPVGLVGFGREYKYKVLSEERCLMRGWRGLGGQGHLVERSFFARPTPWRRRLYQY